MTETLTTVRGFKAVQREYKKNLYLKHIVNKESKFLAEMYASRGIGVADKDSFLEPKLRNLLPPVNVLKDAETAAKRIIKAIDNKEKICIYGDYDVDGTTSTSLMILWLKKLGVEADYYIPDRLTEGYGANNSAVEKIAKNGTKLLIFVDCGATANEQLELANKLGVDVIILDHHKTTDDLPICAAHVNPNRLDETEIDDQLHHICACGVVFLTLISCTKLLKEGGKEAPDLIKFVPLVAFATICDVMALTPLNRAFVRTGIEFLDKNKANPSATFNLYSFVDKSGTNYRISKITPYTFGFIIGPMVNAGGRIGKSDLGVKLMTSTDKKTVSEIAEELFLLNNERKQIEQDALEEVAKGRNEIQRQIAEQGFILVYSKSWHEGVIGLIASRIKERFCYPTIAGTINQDGLMKFSCRSVDGVDIGRLILQAKERGLLENGGGHELAGGLSLLEKNLQAFIDFMREHAKQDAERSFQNRTIEYDTAISLSGLTEDLIETVAKLEPFGIGNPKPVFLVQDVKIMFIDVVTEKHIKIRFTDGTTSDHAFWFGGVGTPLGNFLMSSKGKNIDLLATAEMSEWQGKKQKSIKIEDVVAI